MLTDFWVWSEICCRKIREGALRPILFFKKENNNSVLIAWLSGNKKKNDQGSEIHRVYLLQWRLECVETYTLRCTVVVHSVRYCEIQSPWKLYNNNKKNQKKQTNVAALKKTKNKWFNNYGTNDRETLQQTFTTAKQKKKLSKYRQMFQQLKWIDKLLYAWFTVGLFFKEKSVKVLNF